MNESHTSRKQFSSCASLAALGIKLKDLDLFGPIREQVKIAQKTVKDTPSEKLYDAFISRSARTGGNQYALEGG
jgi:hypothetical protein